MKITLGNNEPNELNAKKIKPFCAGMHLKLTIVPN